MGIENPNIGQILNASLDKEPEIRAAGDVLTSDFEENLNALGLALENQTENKQIIESDPPVVPATFPVVTQTIENINSESVDIAQDIENSTAFQALFAEQKGNANVFAQFELLGGSSDNPRPLDEFSLLTGFTNTDSGIKISSVIIHDPTNTAFLYDAVRMTYTPLVMHPSLELDFVTFQDGEFTRIAPAITNLGTGSVNVITDDFIPSLSGNTQNPGIVSSELYEGLKVADSITEDMAAPGTVESSGPTTTITATEPAKINNNGQIELATFKQPETSPIPSVQLTKIPNTEHPTYKATINGVEYDVAMQHRLTLPDPNAQDTTIEHPDLGVYKRSSIEPGRIGYQASGTLVDIGFQKMAFEKYGDGNQSVDVDVVFATLAVNIGDNRTIYLRGIYDWPSTDFKMPTSPDGMSFSLNRTWDDIEEKTKKVNSGLNMIVGVMNLFDPAELGRLYVEKFGSCDNDCINRQSVMQTVARQAVLIDQLSRSDYSNLEDGQVIDFYIGGVTSSQLFGNFPE